MDWLGLVALVVALVALGVAVGTSRRASTVTRRRREASQDLPTDVLGLRQEVSALRLEAAQALRHLAVVRYDAFGDMGGHLSWTMALLDDQGDGVLVTSIHGRSDARTYAKPVARWSSDQQLSPEEEEAIAHARA
ncbi:MAG TPA: DUF4446 family protein [Marmoricola sp.]|nr:DUF4446 family protein [Marmoricola sp.]